MEPFKRKVIQTFLSIGTYFSIFEKIGIFSSQGGWKCRKAVIERSMLDGGSVVFLLKEPKRNVGLNMRKASLISNTSVEKGVF